MIKVEGSEIYFDVEIGGQKLDDEFVKRNSIEIHALRIAYTAGFALPVVSMVIGSTSLNYLNKFKEINTANAGVNSVDKYKKMAQRHGKLFSKQPFRWLMKRAWGRKLLFAFFGKKKDKKSGWPAWVRRTDEERIQNMPWILENKEPWIATEKIDGTSTTFTMKKSKFGKNDFYVCSRNVVFDKPDKNCYYDTNVYIEMAQKYDVENILKKLIETYNLEWVTLQGETFGASIQKRDYGMKDHDFYGFNLIFSDRGRLGTVESAEIMKEFGITWVPIIDTEFILPDTVDELLAYATDKSKVDGGMREGVVFRSPDGTQSFKAVSNEFLLKYHS